MTHNFTDKDLQTLRCIVGHIIPSSARFTLPGADDPEIFNDFLNSVGTEKDRIRLALDFIHGLTTKPLSEIPIEVQKKILTDFRQDRPDLASAVQATTIFSYYRDPRVLKAIGVEARPPFPDGYEVEQGNWSLLDPVRARGPLFKGKP
jgi:hypothetical protein